MGGREGGREGRVGGRVGGREGGRGEVERERKWVVELDIQMHKYMVD